MKARRQRKVIVIRPQALKGHFGKEKNLSGLIFPSLRGEGKGIGLVVEKVLCIY